MRVPKDQAVEDFGKIINGEFDNLPEEAFYMVGTLQEAMEKAKKLLKDLFPKSSTA